MSAVTPTGPGTPIDRRALLRGGLVGAAALGVAAVGRTTPGSAADLAHRALTSARSVTTGVPGVASYPAATAWEQVLGHEVLLIEGAGDRTRAQVVDVRLVPDSPDVRLEGEAYSVLLDAPRLRPSSARTVAVEHPALAVPSLIIMPVDGDGSWQAVVDRRQPRTHR